jgi:hypothetical protein
VIFKNYIDIMSDNTFDKSHPALVDSQTIQDIENKLNVPFDQNDGNRVLHGLGNFYTEYVQPNMFPIIVILIMCLYLFIKYVLKQDREEKEHKKRKHSDQSEDSDSESSDKSDKSNKSNKSNQSNGSNGSNGSNQSNQSSESNNAQLPEPEPKPDKQEKEKEDIADLISDDYLLTDTEEDKNKDNINHGADSGINNDISNDMFMMPMVEDIIGERNNSRDMDKASKLVFGQ